MSDSNLDITLFRGWADKGSYVWSPFVTKLELRLRLSSISYRTAAGSAKTAPKGKIPYVEIGRKDHPDEALISIGDSSLIARHFEEQGLIDSLDTKLDASSRALDLAVRALMEDRLYFFNMRERWIDNFYVQRDKVLIELPYLLRVMVGLMIYRGHVKTLNGQGTGRFTAEEAKEFREDIWMRLNGLLDESRKKAMSRQGTTDKQSCYWCLGGEEPMECDTTVYAFINSALIAGSSPESREFVRSLPAVIDYATRIHETYFPDYQKWD